MQAMSIRSVEYCLEKQVSNLMYRITFFVKHYFILLMRFLFFVSLRKDWSIWVSLLSNLSLTESEILPIILQTVVWLIHCGVFCAMKILSSHTLISIFYLFYSLSHPVRFVQREAIKSNGDQSGAFSYV